MPKGEDSNTLPNRNKNDDKLRKLERRIRAWHRSVAQQSERPRIAAGRKEVLAPVKLYRFKLQVISNIDAIVQHQACGRLFTWRFVRENVRCFCVNLQKGREVKPGTKVVLRPKRVASIVEVQETHDDSKYR